MTSHVNAPTPAGRAHEGYRHEAYVFHDLEQFLDDTVLFVREGISAGQPVMVAVPPERLDSLRVELGSDAAEVQFVDMTELGANPARIIPAWREFIDDRGLGEQPLRGVGEPIWDGRRPAELVECQLHEALLNLAVSPETPLWLRCPYDASVLPPAVVAEAQRSHPMIVEAGVEGGTGGSAYRGSALYGGTSHVDDIIATQLPAPQGRVECVEFSVEGLPAVRDAVARRAIGAGLSDGRSADLALVLHELATNSLRHGGGRGRLCIWQDASALVAEIQDPGQLIDVLAGRRLSPSSAEGGRGLWLAHQLSDLVQIRRAPTGTTVRVHAWL